MGFQNKEEVLAHVGGKLLAFGLQGTGKSTFLGTFPNINLVDTEDGQTYYLESNPNIKGILRTVSASEVQETLDELNDEEVMDSFDTVLIDSATKLYENMQSAAYEIVEKRAKTQLRKGKDVDTEDLNLAQRDWGHIKRWNQQLATSYILLSSLGKWVAVSAHQKDVFDDPNSKDKKKIGEAPDLAKKAEHDYDVVIQMFTEEDKKTKEIKYYGRVFKDRTGVTKKGDVIENPTFDIWRAKWEATKKFGIKKGVDLSKGVQRDTETMEMEDDKLAELVEEFKTKVKLLDSKLQPKVMKKSKELGIDNPLKTTDLKGLEKLLKFVNELE